MAGAQASPASPLVRIAIVTPYCGEPRAVLARCLASVAAQSVPCDHLLIADGAAQDWLDGEAVRHIRLDCTHGDYGNAARGVGGMLAAAEGYAAVGFLDADNRIDADHVADCLAVVDAGPGTVDVVVAQRRFELPDGTPVTVSDDRGLVDTNCLFLLPGAFPVIARWGLIPPALTAIGDRLFQAALTAAGCRFAHTRGPSVTYVSRWAAHYLAAGQPVPSDAHAIDLAAMARWLGSLSAQERAMIDHHVGAKVGTDADARRAPGFDSTMED